MKLAILAPNNWMNQMKPELEKLGNEVLFNNCSEDCDFLLGMSNSMNDQIERFHCLYPKVPLITYNWDWYDLINKKVEGWTRFVDLMKESKEVWSSSEITAKKCEKEIGIKSKHWFYAYILPEEWEGEKRDDGYIIQASRNDWYKRFDWYDSAAKELDIPHKAFHPKENPRKDYIEAIKHCSFVVCCSLEESIGTLSVMEGVYCRKPALIADFDGATEVWGNSPDIVYFKKDDYEDLKKQMKWLWENKDKVLRTSKKIVDENFTPSTFCKKINDRLLQL
jgi:hypothetical protein